MNILSLFCPCKPSVHTQPIQRQNTALKNTKMALPKSSYNIVDVIENANRPAQVPASPPKAFLKGNNMAGRTAVISGAGIAGLAAAFELHAQGFEVTLVEKRKTFSRFNIINLGKESQAFLRKFNLLDEFEASVAARIQTHQIVVFGKGAPETIDTTNVSGLQLANTLDKDPNTFKDLFESDGIYSVQIKDLQAFLAKKVTALGVNILSESKINIVKQSEEGGVSDIEVTHKKHLVPPLLLKPDLFLIAEGTRSATVEELGMADEKNDVVENDCTNENWVFGNLCYNGNKTFVVSMIITAQKTLQIANVIFNAKSKTVNVAVTSEANPSPRDIEKLILLTAQKAFDYAKVDEPPTLLQTVQKPVNITNRKAFICSKENIFRIGDAVGNSSPLAGLGGTLGVTLVPLTVEQVIIDYLTKSNALHNNFRAYSHAYVQKWIDKSQCVKKAIQGIFENYLALENASIAPFEYKEDEHVS